VTLELAVAIAVVAVCAFFVGAIWGYERGWACGFVRGLRIRHGPIAPLEGRGGIVEPTHGTHDHHGEG
jgi:hypothetical protein